MALNKKILLSINLLLLGIATLNLIIIWGYINSCMVTKEEVNASLIKVDVKHNPIVFIAGSDECGFDFLPKLLSVSQKNIASNVKISYIEWFLEAQKEWPHKNTSALFKPLAALVTELLPRRSLKLPVYIMMSSLDHSKFLLQAYPGAKFILLVCDGRHAYDKYANDPQTGPKTNYISWLIYWNEKIIKMLDACQDLQGGECLVFHYENLLLYPKESLEVLSKYFGLDLDSLWETCLLDSSCKNMISMDKEEVHRNMTSWYSAFSEKQLSMVNIYAPVIRGLGYSSVGSPDYRPMSKFLKINKSSCSFCA